MNSEDFYRRYQELMASEFPEASHHLPLDKLTRLVSPFVLSLPQDVFQQAQAIVKTIYEIGQGQQQLGQLCSRGTPTTSTQKISSDSPQEAFCHRALYKALGKFCPPQIQNQNHSVLMTYDFHLYDDKLKLIEINTNGSGFLLADLCRRAHGLETSLPFLRNSFFEEMAVVNPCQHISIIDKEPPIQKMYLEFIMYKEWFQSWGLDADIYDFRELKWDGYQLLRRDQPVRFIYNRYCDFYLGEEASRHLSMAYRSGKVIFSPQPRDYILFADKQRLIDWVAPSFQEQLKQEPFKGEAQKILQQTLIECRDTHSFKNPQELWEKRKTLFFKPKNNYGSRSVYRGKNITKKNFERSLKENFLVQELIPPAQIHLPCPRDGNGRGGRGRGDNGSGRGSSGGGDRGGGALGKKLPWKYDLRFYAYKDSIQLSIARIYRGQLTNFNEINGGFTAVDFSQ